MDALSVAACPGEVGVLRGGAVLVNNQQVVGPRAAAIPSPAGGTTVDSQARAAIELILTALEGHGLVAS